MYIHNRACGCSSVCNFSFGQASFEVRYGASEGGGGAVFNKGSPFLVEIHLVLARPLKARATIEVANFGSNVFFYD